MPDGPPTTRRLTSEDVHLLAAHEAVLLLGTDRTAGLAEDEASRRRAAIGPNVLPPPARRGLVARSASQFTNPLVVILLAAAAVTLAIGETVDAAVIAGVVVVNALIGVLQESRAERALEALRDMTRTEATVVRGGRRRRLDAREIVPGDLVVLEAGDRVPADLRLTRVAGLAVDESALTGESLPVDKHDLPLPEGTVLAERANLAHAGTLVVAGAGAGVTVATGGDTELGRIQRLVGDVEGLQTPLTRRIARFSRVVTVVILALAAATFVLGLARGEEAGEMLTAAVALAVGAIPEGLPAAVTITLAIGVRRMARRRAIVRRLPAAETLGSTTVICTDKTGTLTENRMTVVAVATAGGVRLPAAPDTAADLGLLACLGAGVLASDARVREDGEVVGDPTEGALLVAASGAGLDPAGLRRAHHRRAVLPFSSERGWMATLDDGPDGAAIHVKGAPEHVLSRCASVLDARGLPVPIDREAWLARAAELGQGGLRVLAIAVATAPAEAEDLAEGDVAGLALAGLQAMRDPPRPAAVAAVAACRDAGVTVKMVTGDQPATAAAIARAVGVAGAAEPRVVGGAELARVPDDELPGLALATDVFARVSPEQKLRLVEALQSRGHVVAMTGDGVNDAPALRRADLGVAMGRGGTEVAKEASDLVLADDDFSTIAAAVEEGRRVDDNLTKFIVWTLPTNLGEGLVILTAIVAGAALPILPTQILWINMTTAVALGLPLAVEPAEGDVMGRPPRDPRRPILDAVLAGRIVLVSALLLAGSYGLFHLERELGASLEEARTVAVNVFVAGEAAYLFNCRSLVGSSTTGGPLSNPVLLLGVGLTALLQLAFTYLPPMQSLFDTAAIGPASWLRILAVAAGVGVVVAAEKAVRRRMRRARPQ